MTRKLAAYDSARFVQIGARYSSEDINRECSAAEARWQRDVDDLTDYGFGPSALEQFRTLWAQHKRLLAERPEAVAAKLSTVRGKAELVTEGFNAVNRAVALLTLPARSDAALADAVNATLPGDDDTLPAALTAFAKLLVQHAAKLPDVKNLTGFTSQLETLAGGLNERPGQVQSAKSATRQDTVAIDELDGRLYLLIGDLNRAGRKAISAGALDVPRSDYRFQYIQRWNRKSAAKPTA